MQEYAHFDSVMSLFDREAPLWLTDTRIMIIKEFGHELRGYLIGLLLTNLVIVIRVRSLRVIVYSRDVGVGSKHRGIKDRFSLI